MVYLACGVNRSQKSYHGLAAIINSHFNRTHIHAVCLRSATAGGPQSRFFNGIGIGFTDSDEKAGQKLFSLARTPDEPQKCNLLEKEMRWLCDGLSLTPQGAFRATSKIIV